MACDVWVHWVNTASIVVTEGEKIIRFIAGVTFLPPTELVQLYRTVSSCTTPSHVLVMSWEVILFFKYRQWKELITSASYLLRKGDEWFYTHTRSHPSQHLRQYGIKQSWLLPLLFFFVQSIHTQMHSVSKVWNSMEQMPTRGSMTETVLTSTCHSISSTLSLSQDLHAHIHKNTLKENYHCCVSECPARAWFSHTHTPL